MKLFSNLFGSLPSFILAVIIRVFWFLELFLFLRLLLKFLRASAQALVVNFIYRYSDFLIYPFKFIFRDVYWRGHLIELATICAMIGYALLLLIIIQIFHLLFRETRRI
jgi:hypothetical protein